MSLDATELIDQINSRLSELGFQISKGKENGSQSSQIEFDSGQFNSATRFPDFYLTFLHFMRFVFFFVQGKSKRSAFYE